MLSTLQTAQQSVDEAVALAQSADAVIAVVGGANNDRAATTEGEGVDRASLNLGGTQALLLQALRGAAPPLVTVLMDGKPTADAALDGLPAVLAAFQGGQACGQAVAEVILGVTEPSGRLPISFPVSAEVLPVYYSRKPSGRSQAYCDVPQANVVRWPFGHGLAYTTFALSNLVVLTPSVAADGVALVNVTVTNSGARAGVAVPQLYLRRAVASVTTPYIALKGFARLDIAPGDSAVASFAVDVAAELALYGRELTRRVEGGNVTVFVGFSSADPKPLAGWFVVAA
jgi:beta-glucosidase